jgi:hypothetical protein
MLKFICEYSYFLHFAKKRIEKWVLGYFVNKSNFVEIFIISYFLIVNFYDCLLHE